ncbi:acetyltransferase (GNAT) family protein [Actinocrispum wychmicini]|uniref:Acetyltransferase (GNAT) family protein n=1 Tax=Actinocrispum wychmicini TaxID=1213861 RepID=A0A4R2K1P3_9PSEU|nr:acetyltransferase (GNAT) family protein [Actinocrispum wychmicini]
MTVRVVELTERTWPALESLFGPNGAVAGCWCMWFRKTSPEFKRDSGEANREDARKLAESDEPAGLLAIEGTTAVGWVAVAPRPVYRRLDRSPIARPVDPAEDLSRVWSVTCFFIHRSARGRGVARTLLDEAVRHAVRHGAWIVEAYPVDTQSGTMSSGELYHGTLSMFTDAGFTLVERRGTRRGLVRKTVG